ncbi:hypothetical protein SELMODRAFT_131128 [Selaginella moellendorffii]|uniref:Pentacotripeptide-repeat region of PRORP domain-containing protein n=1 Tax=Selaginella moellendorffii TaxID=88036 RepID=D8T3M0_SELML|nr:hypothetical protein SELMODRAFT_131128 [Selaginella moellendorffii]
MNHEVLVRSIRSLASAKDLPRARLLHAQIGSAPGRFLANLLVQMYGKCGAVEEAQRLFDKMPEHNLISWNALLAGYAQNGHCDSAIGAFRAMNLEGDAAPNDISLTNVLAACGHKGLLEMSRECFVSVSSDYGLKQCKEQYSCVVDLLGRLGEIEIAEEIVKAMPFVADDVVWGSVLGACRTQEENGMRAAVQAVDWIAQLNPDNGSCYILLANMYATTNP